MTVRQMIDEMQLTPLTCPDPERVVTGGYVGDLLSWVMGRARSGQAWITIMSNINTVAVASLADVAGVILAEGVTLPEDVQRAAAEREICFLTTSRTAYETAAALSACLARAAT